MVPQRGVRAQGAPHQLGKDLPRQSQPPIGPRAVGQRRAEQLEEMLGQRAGVVHHVKGQRGQHLRERHARLPPAPSRQHRHAARADQARPRGEKAGPGRRESPDWECVDIPSVSTDFAEMYKRFLTSANFRKALGLGAALQSRSPISPLGSDGRTMSDPPSPSSPPFEGPSDDRLDSWKEIAAYMRRDVTTVQRWEKREGMPVHRHVHDKLGSVYAFKSDLDAWARSRSLALVAEAAPGGPRLAEERPADEAGSSVTWSATSSRSTAPQLRWLRRPRGCAARKSSGRWRRQEQFWSRRSRSGRSDNPTQTARIRWRLPDLCSLPTSAESSRLPRSLVTADSRLFSQIATGKWTCGSPRLVPVSFTT